MAEVISEHVPRGYYQLFYVYLFLGSLFFLLVIYCDLWRTQAKFSRSKKHLATEGIGRSGSEAEYFDGNYKLPRPRVNYGSFYLRLGAVRKFYKFKIKIIQKLPLIFISVWDW